MKINKIESEKKNKNMYTSVRYSQDKLEKKATYFPVYNTQL